MFFPVAADGANVGTWFYFLDAIALHRRGSCVCRDLVNRNSCSRSRRTKKSDRNTLSVRRQANVLHDTHFLSRHRWGSSRFEATQRNLSVDDDLFCLSAAVREWRNAGGLERDFRNTISRLSGGNSVARTQTRSRGGIRP